MFTCLLGFFFIRFLNNAPTKSRFFAYIEKIVTLNFVDLNFVSLIVLKMTWRIGKVVQVKISARVISTLILIRTNMKSHQLSISRVQTIDVHPISKWQQIFQRSSEINIYTYDTHECSNRMRRNCPNSICRTNTWNIRGKKNTTLILYKHVSFKHFQARIL